MAKDDFNKIKAIFSQLDGADLNQRRGVSFKFRLYLTDKLSSTDIDELQLSVRSTNCLKRNKIYTIGQLCESISSSAVLYHLRNCGKTSVAEIMDNLFAYQYAILSPERREEYLKTIIEMNASIDENDKCN